MGNLIQTFAITSLVFHASCQQTIDVVRDKPQDKKSIVLTVVSESNEPSMSQSDVMRLVINSTHDDSVYISASINDGVNVMIFKDGRDLIDVATPMPDDKIIQFEDKFQELMNEEVPLPEALAMIEILLAEVKELYSEETDTALIERLARLRELLENYRAQLLDPDKITSETTPELNEKVDQLQMKVQALLNEEHDPLSTLKFRTEDLLAEVKQLQSEIADEASIKDLKQLQELLESHHDKLIQLEVDEHLQSSIEALKGELTGENPIELVPTVISQIKQFAEQSNNEILKASALEAIETAEVELDAREKLNGIAESLHVDFFTPENFSIINEYIATLNNVSRLESAVNSLKQEISNLTEAIIVIDTVSSLLGMSKNEFDNAATNVSHIEKMLKEIGDNSRNENFRNQANKLSEMLKEKLNHYEQEVGEQRKDWEKTLNVIDDTLIANRYDGLNSLEFMEVKLKGVIEAAKKDDEIVMRAQTLLEAVDQNKSGIKNAIKLLKDIEKKLHDAKNDAEVKEFEASIEKIHEAVSVVHDKNVISKSKNVIERIQEKINEFRSRRRMVGAQVEASKGLAEDDKLKPGNNVARRMSTNPTVNSDAKELLKVINGYMQDVQPEIKKQITKLADDFERLAKLNQGELNIEGLKDRLRIAFNDYKRITSGLEKIKERLRGLVTSDVDVNAVTTFESLSKTSEQLAKLGGIEKDEEIKSLVRSMVTISMTVEHAIESLKQLQKMIEFNMKLANPKSVEEPLKIAGLSPLGENPHKQ